VKLGISSEDFPGFCSHKTLDLIKKMSKIQNWGNGKSLKPHPCKSKSKTGDETDETPMTTNVGEKTSLVPLI
jgi:hypothetical protein